VVVEAAVAKSMAAVAIVAVFKVQVPRTVRPDAPEVLTADDNTSEF
jgi:hypothetical protein